MKSCFSGKRFYKGNIHTHSTVSDGMLTPEEVVSEYKKRGYDFLAFTEHEIYSNYTRFESPGFITIQGVEFRVRMPKGDVRDYHFILLPGSDEDRQNAVLPMFAHGENLGIPLCNNYGDIQAHIDGFRQRGYMVMINHPFWSRIEYDEILPFNSIFGMEVFNFSTQIIENMGESNVIWDALLRNGKRLWGTAVDDNHNNYPIDSAKCDSFGGFIAVKADALGERELCNAISEGSFYASMGPEIYEFCIEKDVVHFECSPVEKIYINGHGRQIHSRIAESKDQLLTGFDVKLMGDEKYVRMEIYDTGGKKAYTNPIFLDIDG